MPFHRAIVAVFLPREHLPFIRGWCEHHLAQGWEVHLYNNSGSTGSRRNSSVFSRGTFQAAHKDKRGNRYGAYTDGLDDEAVEERLRHELRGLPVTVVPWQPRDAKGRIMHDQVEAYADFIERERARIDWAAFLDADEYLHARGGWSWEEVIGRAERASLDRLRLCGVSYESRWSAEGWPRDVSRLRCCGAQKSCFKNLVRLRDVLRADIHWNWKTRSGHFATLDPAQYHFRHYNRASASISLAAEVHRDIRPDESVELRKES